MQRNDTLGNFLRLVRICLSKFPEIMWEDDWLVEHMTDSRFVVILCMHCSLLELSLEYKGMSSR